MPHSVPETLIPPSGLHTLRSSDHAGQAEGSTRKKIVFLLTDGQPSKGSRPPEGELAALRTYLESYPSFHCQIATFGFGYKLDSELLEEISKEGGSVFSFISDAPMVGNVFTRALANVLTTHSQRAVLHLTPLNGSKLLGPALGGFKSEDAPWGLVVNIGPLQYGQYREIIVPIEMPSDPNVPFLDVTLEYGDPVQRISLEAQEREVEGGALSCEVAMLRAEFIDKCAALLKQKPLPSTGGAEPLMRALVQRFESSDASGDERVVAMHSDIVGRMSKALDGSDRYKRWGSHYIRGLLRAHELQQCTKYVKVLASTIGTMTPLLFPIYTCN